MEYTKKQIEEWKAKAKKWDDLRKRIDKFYVDADGNELSESDGGDLGDIGEVAAQAFGYL